MTLNEINLLARRLPPSTTPVANPLPSFLASDELGALGFDDHAAAPFLHGYGDLSFGWRAAMALADAEAPFPFFPAGRTRWVWLAWRLLQDRKANANKAIFKPVMDAVMIQFSVQGRATRDVLKAFLIASDATIDAVAELTAIDREVVDAFDALFFNASDRREDHMYLRNIAYPNTRMEEMLPGYLDKGNLAQIMLRQSYNNTLHSASYLAGFRTDYGMGMDNAQATEAFQTGVMRLGHLYVNSGFLNLHRQHPGIAAARALVVAGKLGGQDTTGADAGGSFGDAFTDQLRDDAAKIRESMDRRLA